MRSALFAEAGCRESNPRVLFRTVGFGFGSGFLQSMGPSREMYPIKDGAIFIRD